MITFLIPLRGVPESFEVSLAGVPYIFTVYYNDSPDGGWQFDLANAETDEVLAACLPLIVGANCLEGLDYLGIGGDIVVFTDGDETAPPAFENLGTESNVYFQTDVEENG